MRTPRELTLIAGGLWVCGHELARAQPDYWNLTLYALFTVLFAARFFAARAMLLGLCLGALAMWAPLLVYHLPPVQNGLPWEALAPLCGALLLASPDLVYRFDRSPSRWRWLPNRWATLPPAHARRLRWCSYGAGITAALLGRVWLEAGVTLPHEAWAPATAAALTACLVLLLTGRAAALLALPALCAPVVVAAGLQLGRARGPLFAATPEFALPVFAAALVATAMALPYAVGLVRRNSGRE